MIVYTTEGKCVSCGNHTEISEATGVCKICNENDQLPQQSLHIAQPNKIYNLAVPNLASDAQHAIARQCLEIARTLLDKNRKYGDSVFFPQRIFSTADMIEQINVRIDDKLSRIKSAQEDDDEDVELDLIGYLIIRRVAKSLQES